MNRNVIIILVFLTLIFSNGCVSLRSAEGLREGELNVNYVAPGVTSMRYGITNNVEVRTGYAPAAGDILAYSSLMTDVFIHTQSDSNGFNYGITIGSLLFKERKPIHFSSFTISKRISKYFNPYVSVNGGWDGKSFFRNSPRYSNIVFGTEVTIPLIENDLQLLFTPDITIIGDFAMAMNVGLKFDIHSIFK